MTKWSSGVELSPAGSGAELRGRSLLQQNNSWGDEWRSVRGEDSWIKGGGGEGGGVREGGGLAYFCVRSGPIRHLHPRFPALRPYG